MRASTARALRRAALGFVAAPLVVLAASPLVGLVLGTSISDLAAGIAHPVVRPALLLSLGTTAASGLIVIPLGTALAWLLAGAKGRFARTVELIVELPVVIPPSVVGVGLLLAFGRAGPLRELWSALGISLPFSTAAVVIAQVVVSAPFFVQSAAAAFRTVDRDLLAVARSLGAGPFEAFLRVAVPLAAPGLITGAALAWARALGEFGATLLFAGNLPNRTQTLPLAIYTALERDVRAAQALSIFLIVIALVLLAALRGPIAGRIAKDLRTEGHTA